MLCIALHIGWPKGPLKLYQTIAYPSRMSSNGINRMEEEVNYLDAHVKGLGKISFLMAG